MEALNDLLKQISETVMRLEQLRESSVEVREALALQAEQEQLVKRLQEQCKEQMPPIVPMPYPVYPAMPDWTYYPPRYDWWNSPYRAICTQTADTSTPLVNRRQLL